MHVPVDPTPFRGGIQALVIVEKGLMQVLHDWGNFRMLEGGGKARGVEQIPGVMRKGNKDRVTPDWDRERVKWGEMFEVSEEVVEFATGAVIDNTINNNNNVIIVEKTVGSG